MESKQRHDSLASSVSTSETDLLSDMIPYRCPKCGNQRKFAALRNLKHHLDEEHSFKMGCVKPRSRNKVFNHRMVTEKPKVTTGKYIKTKYGGTFSPRSSDSDENYGSMLKYYEDEAKILERKVKMAKETEIKNKLNRNIMPNSKKHHPPDISSARGDNLKESFANVNNQLLRSRHKEWKASEARYQTEDVIQGVEKAAENRCLDQQVVIRDLVNDLRQKEGQLNRANTDLDKVRREREALMLEVEDLFSEANTGNTVLREELGRREHMLGDMNRQLDTLRARARHDLDRKEDELVAAESRVEGLEKEREHLVQGTNALLEKADKDRAALQHTVQTKERQLRHVNKDLEKLKMEQGDLVQESIHLYEKANEGTAKLKHLVQAKDNQLQEAYHELEGMNKVHEKLIWQSKALTEQADSNNQTLTEMLQSKEEELESAKQNLSKLKESNMAAFHVVLADKEAELAQARNELTKVKAEKDTILESVNDLTQKASNQGNTMAGLQNLVQEKEQKLQEKERDIDSLKRFLSSAAEKEVVARSKLEKFISGLINRADKAESELHKLKTRSVSEVDLSRSHTLGDVSDAMESDLDGQWSSQQSRKVRARSQDSRLKSADYSKLSSRPDSTDRHTLDVTQERPGPNAVSIDTSKPRSGENVKPWQKILRKNCLSDTNSTDDSELESLNSELEVNLSVVSDRHQNFHSRQHDNLHAKKRHLKKTASLDKALLSQEQNTEVDQSNHLSHLTRPIKHRDDNNIRSSVTVDHSGSQDGSVPNKFETMAAKRNHGVFHFGQTNNDSGVSHNPLGVSFPRHGNQNLSHNVLHSNKPTKTNTRILNQFPPQTQLNQTIPFSEYATSQTINAKPQHITRSTLVTNVPDQTTIAMVHPPPQQMVPGRVSTRRNFAPRTKSESDLKQTINAERSHQLNQQLMDSYLTEQPLDSNFQEYHQHYPEQSFPQTVPQTRNVSVPQNRHRDIPSYNTDVSSSQRFQIRPFQLAKGQEYQEADVSYSQRYPIGPFTQVKGQGHLETDVSSSQRNPIGPFTQVKDQNCLETDISSSQRFPLAPISREKIVLPRSILSPERRELINNNVPLENLSNRPSEDIRHSSDIQVKQGHLVRPNSMHGTQSNVTGPNEFQPGQGHSVGRDRVQLGQSHYVRTDGAQQTQGHLAISNTVQQSQSKLVNNECPIMGQPNGYKGRQQDARVMYIPVDSKTGRPVYLTGQPNAPLYGTPGIPQTPGVPTNYEDGAIGIPSQGDQAKRGGMTVNPQLAHSSYATRDIAPSTRHQDQSQNFVTSQPSPVNRVDAGSDYPVLTTEHKFIPTHQTARKEPSDKLGVSKSSSSSVVDGNGDHENSLSDVMSLVDYEDDMDEPDDVESATFEQFMDENGILWESSDTFKDHLTPDSLNQRKSGTTRKIDRDSQVARESEVARPHFQRVSLSGRLNSSQRDQARRSKSAEPIPYDRQECGVRNRSMSPRVRFSDQQQYWPFSEDNTSHRSSSQRSKFQRTGKNHTQRSLCSQSEEEVLERSFCSVIEDRPNFEELWLKDVSVGTDTPSIENYVPLPTRSTKLALRQKMDEQPILPEKQTTGGSSPCFVKKKDQSCQPLKESSTQTWLLDCPLSLDDLGSVSQRSSFVRPNRASKSDSISCDSMARVIPPVKRLEGKEADNDTIAGNSHTTSASTNRAAQMSPCHAIGQRSEVQSENISSHDTRFEGEDLIIDRNVDSTFNNEGKGFPSKTKYEEKNKTYQSQDSRCGGNRDDRPSNLLYIDAGGRDQSLDSRDINGHSPNSKCRRDDRIDQSPDSGYRYDQSQELRHRNDQSPELRHRNDRSPDTRHRYDQSPNSRYRNDRSPELRHRSDRPPDTRYIYDQSPESRYRNDQSPDTRYRYDQSSESKYRNDQSPHSKYSREDRTDQSLDSINRHGQSPKSKCIRGGRNDQSKHSRYTEDRTDQFPNSKYRNDQSPNSKYRKDEDSQFRDSRYNNDHHPVKHDRYRKDGKRYDHSQTLEYKTTGRKDYSDECDDSQDDWTDHDNKNSIQRVHKRGGYYSNTNDEDDDIDLTGRARKKDRSYNRKSPSRNSRSSSSESDSHDSGHRRRSEKFRHKKRSDKSSSLERQSSIKEASQCPHQDDLSASIGNSESLNPELKPIAPTDYDQQNTSKVSPIASPDDGVKINSEDSKDLDVSIQNQNKVISEMSELNANDSSERETKSPACNTAQILENSPDGVQHESKIDATDILLVAGIGGQQHQPTEDTEAEQMAHRKDDHVVMDTDDQYSLYSIGSSSLSRTSSQESLLESLPKSRREAVRQRRTSLYLVFRYLDTKSLGRVAGVCREWKKVSRQSALWKRVHLTHTRFTSKALQTLARWCTQLESLHLEDIYTRKQLELESDEDFAQAVRASLEGGLECLLQVSESSLKSIIIINCPHILTDKCMWLASCYSRMLQNVCYHSNTHILGADVLWALGAGCGLIRSLDIAPLYPCVSTEKFTNKCLQIISQFLPELDRLCIGGQQLDVNGFVLIAQSCQRLYCLSLHGCVDIEEDVALAMCRKGLKNLRSLDFNHTPVTDKALLHFYSSCKHLKSIHVSFCTEDVSKDPELKDTTENFNKRIKALEKLKKKGGLWNILKLDVQRVND
ncbi:uncharacterized protein LOC110449242 [Mizuhopecten yessoensis]|uniref:uncharacterized protein LOC110449242 n=1 Tax=Mizuhopecten yessoensis TaxID=6573 RepID=UPI000B458F89|nr:uncharacterized protein LOC110449242 [Mizuhopecten yessoensis]